MKNSRVVRIAAAVLVLGLVLLTLDAHAQINSSGVMDDIAGRYRNAAAGWSGVITKHASWLFWSLVIISMVWTFGFMALRRADSSEFFAESIRFVITTGFFWWLLINAVAFSTSVMDSLRRIAGEATSLGTGTISPSGIVDIGFAIFGQVVDKSSFWEPIDSVVGMAIALAVLAMLALVAINMLLLLITGWFLAFGGVFYLGFGGGRWTTEMAINYYKMVLKIGMELFAMVLLVGIGKTFLNDFYGRLGSNMTVKDLAVLFLVGLILLVLVSKLPSQFSSIVSGGPVGGSGTTGLGAGAMLGAASLASAGAAMAGAMLVAGAANAAGGAQALMAAFNAAGAGDSGVGSGGGGLATGLLGGPGGSVDAGGSSSDSGGSPSGGGSPGSTPFGSAAGFGNSHPGACGGTGFGQRMTAVSDQIKRGVSQMARERFDKTREEFADRVKETPGAKLASTIRGDLNQPAPAQTAATKSSPSFDGDNLSKGDNESDPEDEIASFVARNPDAVDDEDMFKSKD